MKRFVTPTLMAILIIVFAGCKATVTGPNNDDRGGSIIHKGVQPPNFPILEERPIGF